MLCVAYQAIRAADPGAIIVSAGLAPVGRIDNIWNGHYGHDGQNQDEREWMHEFIAAEGHNCADVIGFHPMGFRADFDAEPDIDGGTPETDCTNGFCFRTIEKFREVMDERQIDMPIWATEVGWIVAPPEACLSDPSWTGREWQIVTPEARDANIAGALDYAEDNYPWLEALFVFNLNFSEAPWYDLCEQMRYYSVGSPVVEFTRTYLPLMRRE